MLSNIAGSLRLCRCCNRFQKKKRQKKKCNVAEPTVMAELSKCCSAFSVANIAVPSNIAKYCRVLYKRKQEVCNVCRAYRCDGSFKYCSAFNGCNYFIDLKNVANVERLSETKKQILQSLQIWYNSQMLQCFLMLRILLCLQNIAICCRVIKKKK